MKNIFVVYNPVSGRKKKRDLKSLLQEKLDKEGYSYCWYETKKKGNDFSDMVKGDYDLILAVGGDGTVSEVATFMISNNVRTALGVIGIGSTNLLAWSLRIPVIDSLKSLSFALEKEPRSIDVGVVDGKVFLIAAGKGYDNVFMKGATRNMKRKMGFFAYVWSFLSTYFAHRGVDYRVEIDGEVHKVHAKAVLIFNFFRLRGVKFKLDDGVMEVVAFNPSFFSKAPKIRFFAGKNIRIVSNEPSYQLDGDVFDGENTLNAKVVRKGLKVVY